MKKTCLKALLILGLTISSAAFANEDVPLDKAPINPADQASLQRGAKLFVNYCLGCHSANYMRYNRLKDIGLTDAQIKDNLMMTGEKVGDMMKIAMPRADAQKWFGAAPPDLTVEARARTPDWLYTYLRSFYRDDSRPNGWNNTVFPNVGMPHALWELQGQQTLNHETHQLELPKPGKLTKVEYDAAIVDLVNFMAYMAEPGKSARQHLGIWVLLFLGVLFVLTYKMKKEIWKDIR